MKRRGMFLIEMGVAGVLLAAFTMLCLKYFMVTSAQRRALDQRQTALLEASNIMERLFALPSSDMTSETMSKISLSPETQSVLSGAELKIDLADKDAKPPAKRIAVTIRWRDQSDQWAQPVRLVAWRFQ